MSNKYHIQLAPTDQCTGCTACASICPVSSIAMREDKEGFLQPHIDLDICIGCHKCEKICPIVTPIEIPNLETKAYAAINKDENVRARSSSGGMFYALAKWTIERGGVVFGARFNENWEVVHDYTETIEDIEPFMRSKYVQSRIGETYKQAKEFLKKGRQVLFTGTPCQISGLYAFLGKDYENLLLVDIICYGIPSPKLWRQYIKDTFKDRKIQSFNFRDKKDGWFSNPCVVVVTANGKEQEIERMSLIDNPYFRWLRRDVYARKSCYHCPYRKYHRISDVTIGDYWGAIEMCPEMYDNKGTSIIFVHTEKGDRMLSSISATLRILAQERNNAVSGNRGMDRDNPRRHPMLRMVAYQAIAIMPFTKAMKCVELVYKLSRIPHKIKKILSI